MIIEMQNQLIRHEEQPVHTSKKSVLFSPLEELLKNNELLPTTGISTPKLLITGFFAVLSGLMYFFSARKAGVRYDENTHHNQSWFFVWFLATASGVTNIEFNWQAFVEITDTNSYKKLPRNIANIVLKPLVALSAAMGTIAPFWLTASNSGEGKVVDGFINLSAALNIPVCFLGAYILFSYEKLSSVQRLRLRAESLFVTEDKRAEKRDDIELTLVKDFFITELRQRYEDFYYATSNDREDFRKNLKADNLLTSLLLDSSLPLQISIIHQSNFLWYLKYFVLGPICMSQNIPHVIEAYQAGESIYPGFGYFCAAANLIPGLAFTFVGILGFGFVEVFFETWLGMAYALGCPSPSRVSQLQRLFDASVGWSICAAFLALATISRIFYTFSGFSGDAIGWNAWMYVNGSQYVTPMVFALFANLGSVIVNGPYTERLIRELREKAILSFSLNTEEKLQIQCQQTLGRAITVAENASINDVSEFVTDPSVQEILKNPTMQAKFAAFYGEGYIPSILLQKDTELVANPLQA